MRPGSRVPRYQVFQFEGAARRFRHRLQRAERRLRMVHTGSLDEPRGNPNISQRGRKTVGFGCSLRSRYGLDTRRSPALDGWAAGRARPSRRCTFEPVETSGGRRPFAGGREAAKLREMISRTSSCTAQQEEFALLAGDAGQAGHAAAKPHSASAGDSSRGNRDRHGSPCQGRLL